MLAELSEWLSKLAPSAASFLGTVTGSALGLLAILCGALFNAYLNRRRDDSLREIERRSIIAALSAELTIIIKSALDGNAARVADTPADDTGGFLGPDLAHLIHIYPTLLPKLGLLDSAAIKQIVSAYSLIQQYCESLIFFGGQLKHEAVPGRRLIFVPATALKSLQGLSTAISKNLEAAITVLDARSG